MTTPFACATACGIGTGPAPISSSGSVGKISDNKIVLGTSTRLFIEASSKVYDHGFSRRMRLKNPTIEKSS